jgi:hypothetical protein
VRVGKAHCATLEQKGYVPISVAAARTGFDAATIGRWIDSGHVRALRVAGTRFVEWESVVTHVGPEAMKLLTPDGG